MRILTDSNDKRAIISRKDALFLSHQHCLGKYGGFLMGITEKKCIAVKIGTSSLTYPEGTLNLKNMDKIAQVISDMKHRGFNIILISSGAIAVGVNKLSLKERPEDLRIKQAAASVGQCELMHLYDKFFGEYGITVGQILLTREDIGRDIIKDNLSATIQTLMDMGAVPIINENDSVSYEEIESDQKLFGDNDTLSALVAVFCGADALVLLSDIDGLYEEPPHLNPSTRIIREVRVLNDEIKSRASGAGSTRGTGGMVTKLDAAGICMENGIDMIIANGSKPQLLYNIADGEPFGTLFVAKKPPAGGDHLGG